MEKNKLSKEQIEMILDDKYTSIFWIYYLGLMVEDKQLTTDNYLSSNFFKKGTQYWEEVIDKIKAILCNEQSNTPKEEILAVLNDQNVNIAVYLVTLIANQLDVIFSIAIPLVALILNKGLHKFCTN